MKHFLIYLLYLITLFIFVPFITIFLGGKEQHNADEISVYIKDRDEIQYMKREEYLKGVVSAEMPAEFEIEALKAQAVAARTYLEAHIGTKDDEHKGADICTDFKHCAAWISKEERMETWENDAAQNWDKIAQAVDETKGEIITYNNEIISAVFHSTSSGKTENAEDVWSKPVDYLKSVESEGDEFSPKFYDQKELSATEYIDIIKSKYENADEDEELYDDIKRSESGGIKSIEVLGVKMKGTEFRTLFGLRSTNIEFSENEENIVMKTKGYGHGVGMSQYGANYMASQGKTYQEILKHYYTGVEISKR